MRLYKLLKQINFERLAGSEGEARARSIIIDYLSKLNLKITEHPFEMNCFETGRAEVIFSKHTIKAHPLGLVTSADIQGELVFVENSEEVFCQKGKYEGKIILTYIRTAKLMNRLKEENVKAVIFISDPYKKLSATNLRQKNYEEGAVPAVSILYKDAKRLAKQHGKTIYIEIKQNVQKKTAKNIVVDIKGTGQDKTLTCICAHYDSVATSKGAHDNGAGAVIILKVAEYFITHPPKRDLRIIFFTGEEMGLLGSFAYTNDFKEELKNRMGLLINVDVSGDDIGINDFHCIGTNEILGYVDGVLKESGYVFKKSLEIYSSDCMPFSVYEIPSINLSRWKGDATCFIHTADDTADKCTQHGLLDTYNATLILCQRLLNADIYPIKTDIDQSLKEKIEEYIYNSTMTEPKLEWKKKYEK